MKVPVLLENNILASSGITAAASAMMQELKTKYMTLEQLH